jgi:Leucine-rich repeat (LRR) protein
MPDAAYRVVTPSPRFDPMPGQKVLYVSGGWPSDLGEIIQCDKVQRFHLSDCDDSVVRILAQVASYLVDLSVSYEGNRIRDWSLLGGFSSLERLSLGDIPSFALVDFAALPHLRYLEGQSKSLNGLEKAVSLRELSLTCPISNLSSLAPLQNLEQLILESRKLESVAGIEELHRLRDLDLVGGSIESLSGLEAAPTLEILHLQDLKRLTCIDAVAELPRLRILWIDKCKKIADLTPIGKVVQLKKLWLEFLDEIPSISFLSALRSLRYVLMGGTLVKDRDLSVLLDLPELEFVVIPADKHYPPDIIAALGDKLTPLPQRPGFSTTTFWEITKG